MKYYQKLAILLALLWGFIALQRIVIAIIMPAIAEEMKFTYTDVGLVLAITGLTWAFGTIIFAAIGDKIGRRPVIVVTAILAAVFSWVTGFVHTLGGMLTVRGILGFFEGGPWAPSVSTLVEESPPEKRGLTVGYLSACFMLIGVAVGPIVATRILAAYGSWRPVFYILSIPAAVLAVIILFFMHEAPSIAETLKMRKSGQKKVIYHQGQKMRLIDVLKFKNVTVSTINSIPVMAVLWVYTGFSALFLFKVHQFNMGQVGIALAASGVGGCLGVLSMGGLSDHIGRKTAMIICGLLCAASGAAVALLPLGTPLGVFLAPFFFWGFFGIGTFPLYLGTLPTECVPPECAGTAASIPTGVGEFLGASAMPALAGYLADKLGLVAPVWMTVIAGVLIAIISLFYVETAPAKVAKMKIKPSGDDYLLPPFRGKQPTSAR